MKCLGELNSGSGILVGDTFVQTLLLVMKARNQALVLLPGAGLLQIEELFGGHVFLSLLCKYQELFLISLVNQIDARLINSPALI